MQLVVMTCAKYQDAWQPFIQLMDHFWPGHPAITLVTDELAGGNTAGATPVVIPGAQWCNVVADFAKTCTEPFLMFLEDFLPSGPFEPGLIERGVEELQRTGAGCVRLYPCPGGDEEYGDPHFAVVPRGAPYRISTQAAIWDPAYLGKIAGRFDSPWNFEIFGTTWSNELPETVLAFKRDVEPWPVQYLCTGITRGQWNPDSKRMCDSIGLVVDWSIRGWQP